MFSPLPPFAQLLHDKGRLYGVVRDYGLVVVDNSDPFQPRQIAFSPQSAIEKGTVEGRYAYLSLGQRLKIVDIGTPSSPTEVFDLDSGLSQIEDLLVSNRFLYAAGNGLSIVDVSDPINSFVTGHLDLPFQVNAIAKKGDRVYLTTTTSNVPEPFIIVDVSDSANPQVTATAAGSGIDIALFGEFAYLAAGDAGLRLINVSDPSQPVAWPGINTTGYAGNLAIWDHYLFTATGEAGAVVFDITDQSNPLFLGRFQAPNISNVTVISNTVYLLDATERPPNDRNVELAGSGAVYQVIRSVSTIRISPGAGGVVQNTNGQSITTTLTIPPAAVGYTTTLLLANAENASWPIGRAIVRQAVDLLAYRDHDLFPDLIFDAPLTLTMEYLDTKLGVVSDKSGIGIEWSSGGVWAHPATTCHQQPATLLNAASPVAVATFCQTGQFALIGPTNSLIFPFVPLQTRSIEESAGNS